MYAVVLSPLFLIISLVLQGFVKPRIVASCCQLDKGTPLSARRLQHDPLLKRAAFCVHIVRSCLVFSLSFSGKRSVFRGSMDVWVKSEHDIRNINPNMISGGGVNLY